MTEIEVQGQTVYVREPKVKTVREANAKFDTEAEIGVHLVAACLVDKDGAPVFTPEQVDDWPWSEFTRVLPTVRSVAFGPQDDEQKKD